MMKRKKKDENDRGRKGKRERERESDSSEEEVVKVEERRRQVIHNCLRFWVPFLSSSFVPFSLTFSFNFFLSHFHPFFLSLLPRYHFPHGSLFTKNYSLSSTTLSLSLLNYSPCDRRPHMVVLLKNFLFFSLLSSSLSSISSILPVSGWKNPSIVSRTRRQGEDASSLFLSLSLLHFLFPLSHSNISLSSTFLFFPTTMRSSNG